MQIYSSVMFSHSTTPFACVPHAHTRLPTTISAVAAPPLFPQITHSMPPEKAEIFKYLEPFASERILPLLKPVSRCWQPSDLLPDSSQSSDHFSHEVRALRDRTAGLPDDYLVMLVGDLITEENLPTYQTYINTFDGIRDDTICSPKPWATWLRAWTAEENRHGDLLRTYLYLSGRVDMKMIDRTVQYLIGAGMDVLTENNPYLGFVYTSFQERVAFISRGNTARLVKEAGDEVLARICGSIASDEKRHEMAYTRIIEKLLEIDPNNAMVAIGDMMRKKITMPGHLMYDGQDPHLYHHFSAVAQRLGIYTTEDYADILEFFIGRWNLEKMEGLNGEGRSAQDFVCKLAPIIRKMHERAHERAQKLEPKGVKFSWIFNKELPLHV